MSGGYKLRGQIELTNWKQCICKLDLICSEPVFQDLDILCRSSFSDPFTLVLENDFGRRSCGYSLATCWVFSPVKEEELHETDLGSSGTKALTSTQNQRSKRKDLGLVASDSPQLPHCVLRVCAEEGREFLQRALALLDFSACLPDLCLPSFHSPKPGDGAACIPVLLAISSEFVLP